MLPNVPGYQAIKLLGQGSDGKVYKAFHTFSKTEVAIKAVVKHKHNNTHLEQIKDQPRSGRVHRASREAKILKKLDHPFVLKVLDTVETAQHYFLIMQYAENGDLFDFLYESEERDACGCIDVQLAKRIFAQTVLALEYSHQCRIVHRDIKPGKGLNHYLR